MRHEPSKLKRALEIELSLRPHPNVCRLLCWAYGPPTMQLLLAFEHCEGGSLA
eukprot:CAMPEP_0119320802 /NCGR_PEP_ID=MMETSP1333-20130426/53506_1 /TAXON_ID=418940 /ORGANISM="Scyphosphaera apsteinii, Strain RCC1455" /LENGTH=52 /DNA_ID=CAMNT_0007327603 /DNA_START=5 /DNA_END=160 /DNA_ORIENTATION=+